MTITRRQQRKFPFLRYLGRQRLGIFLCLILLASGYFFVSKRVFPSNVTAYKQREHGDNKRVGLFLSPEDIPIDLIRSLDAILVLGGGRPKSIDHPPVFVEQRCDDAIEVVRRRVEGRINGRTGGVKGRKVLKNNSKQESLPILCLSAGTAHLPQLLSADGLPIWESTACASYILSQNQNSKTTTAAIIPPDAIFVETSSYDTIGNAYFARTSHTEFNGWRKLLVVTNEFHMIRTMKIFEWVFSTPSEKDLKQLSQHYDLYYLESPNTGMTSEVVADRKEREASSAKSVDHLSKKYTTLREIYGFLTQEHSLYAASMLVNRGHASASEIEKDAVKDTVKQSYGAI